MPLAFESISHGTVAFGFFNIESDLLLLEHLFFFASDFCQVMKALAEDKTEAVPEYQLLGYDLPFQNVGDLHGAISGTRLSGFIGETYKLFPFPKQLEAFKQNPEGYQTRRQIEVIIERFGRKVKIPVRIFREKTHISIAEYVFSYAGFHALLNYVCVGGYPRWKDERRPPYVLEMVAAIEKSHNALLEGFILER